ncbi:MAG: sigma-70 family RNA polymerase sigma factor [Xanthomonadales bacterium]|nr:sigma-70 family RNA polymerase sigma factor [Xanthomonadales bacterium]
MNPKTRPDDSPTECVTSASVDDWFRGVYDELHAAAHRVRLSKHGDTLNTTLLVHELYLRLRKSADEGFAGKAQFFAYAGRALRSIMIDHARRRIAERESNAGIALLNDLQDAANESFSPTRALALEESLKLLEADDARAAKVVELHFFAGLTLVECATHLNVNVRTVDRDWRYARAFLQSALDA